MYYIGIDLGTSAIKILLVDGNGKVERMAAKPYPLLFPQKGWAEQNPDEWWQRVDEGMLELLSGFPADKIAGISFSGQMHGLVILDEKDQIIRPAILWNDGRTEKEVVFLNEVIGKQNLLFYTGNIAFAGFTAPKLLWLKKNEPENFRKIKKIMLPKDYLAYRMTGVHCTDYTDASGTLLLDVKNKKWSEPMMTICGISVGQMPRLFESSEPVGFVRPDLVKRWGLKNNVIVAAGAGDNAAAAIGTNTVDANTCNLSLGTSGTIFIPTERYVYDNRFALHSFAHANGSYHLMGCILSAASCYKWWMESILFTKDYAGEQELIEKLGENHVYFLPYLMGERSPHNDSSARAAFIGMSMDTLREDMTQAVLEGVAFAVRDSYEIAKMLGVTPSDIMISGGGSKNKLWKKIIANVLNVRVVVPSEEEAPGMGAAILAMVACGEYESVQNASNAIISTKEVYEPDADLTGKYEKQYRKYRKFYPALKGHF